ncbi:MAG: ATP-dependent Clp protease proteolytic subunit [Luteolibacter sp.]|jgi:ATP-dependent Clp protease protease subunit|nr:ATP-dependent Clp protease proteolytic subunit [Luteolibacter sp.]
MKPLPFRSLIFCLALAVSVSAKETPPGAAEAAKAPENPELEAKRKEQETLAIDNKLEAERLTQATNAMRAEVTRLKLERELMTEKLAHEDARRTAALKQELARLETEKERLAREGELSKVRAEKLANDLKVMQTEAALDLTRLQNEIARFETGEKRDTYADSKPIYLKSPLRDDGTLVISDRRIPLNGMITTTTADFITNRIDYWNNKDRELPIFIVIDASPGGSVMAGYRILKTMESSDAPVHVVVKSFAASMAAAITTLAKESYAYPNAVILHHQISAQVMGQLNLTQQREFHEESNRWWIRFGTPIADKMGLTTDDLIKKMYARSSSGDWSEFGEDAQKLKWVNHIVQGIDETSFTKDPDSSPATGAPSPAIRPGTLAEEVDSNGKPFVWLPRLDPKDVYFLYNPDGYYRMR